MNLLESIDKKILSKKLDNDKIEFKTLHENDMLYDHYFYENNQIHGIWKRYKPNGSLQKIYYYKKGKCYIEEIYYNDNQTKPSAVKVLSEYNYWHYINLNYVNYQEKIKKFMDNIDNDEEIYF